MKLNTIMLIAACMSFCSCTAPRPKQAMTKTTTTNRAAFGVSPVTTTTETPYESPAYTAAGAAMFARP